jgi:hypothetical protein
LRFNTLYIVLLWLLTLVEREVIPIGLGFGTNETSIRQKQPKAIVSFLNPIGIRKCDRIYETL